MDHPETSNEIVLLVNRADQAPGVAQPFAMQSFDIFPVDPDIPRIWPERAVEQAKKRSLTGAAGSDKGDPFTPINSKTNPV